jgi:hypothetical protein
MTRKPEIQAKIVSQTRFEPPATHRLNIFLGALWAYSAMKTGET